jgi:hypothetical protein
LLKEYSRLERLPPGSEEFEQNKLAFRAGLAEETSDVLGEYELFLHEHVENSRAARVAATAPTQAQWAAIIRQENALHRQLERKIRLLEEIQEKRKKREEARRTDLLSKLVGGPHPSGGPRGGEEEPETPNDGECAVRSCGEEPGTREPAVRVTSVSAGLQQPGHPEVSDLENQFCGTRCAHLGVRQRSLRSCRLEGRQPTAQAVCPKCTRCHGCSSTDRARQFCATPSCGEEPRTAKPAVRATRNPRKILNRGNELKHLLNTNDLAFFDAQNEPVFQPRERPKTRKFSWKNRKVETGK